MDIKQLRYFVEIAKSGGFRSASQSLLVSQPPLSRHISALESELGCKLFERHAWGVTLTLDGVQLLERARTILSQVDSLSDLSWTSKERFAGIVSIGSSEAIGDLLVRRFGTLAERLREIFPEVKLRMKTGNSFIMMDGLLAGTIDLAVMIDPQPRGGIRCEKLSTQKFMLVGPRGDPNLKRSVITIRDLADLPLIMFDRTSSYRMLIDRAAHQASMSLNVLYEVERSEIIQDVASRGLAYGVLSAIRARRAAGAGLVSAVEIADLTLDRMLVIRDGVRNQEVVDAVASLIRALVTAPASPTFLGLTVP
jgi:LysR family nitrogen assimilation transcriptional regulator